MLLTLTLLRYLVYLGYAGVAELADAHDSKSCSVRSEGSSPSFGTNSFLAYLSDLEQVREAFLLPTVRAFHLHFSAACDNFIIDWQGKRAGVV